MSTEYSPRVKYTYASDIAVDDIHLMDVLKTMSDFCKLEPRRTRDKRMNSRVERN